MIKSTFTILLSIILLVSHLNITIGTHYCGGKVVESKFLFGDTHLGCIMSDMTMKSVSSDALTNLSQSHKTRAVIFNKPCCENVFQSIQSTDEYTKDAPREIISDYAWAIVYAVLKTDNLPKIYRQFYSYNIPPPLEKKLHILFSTFLI